MYVFILCSLKSVFCNKIKNSIIQILLQKVTSKYFYKMDEIKKKKESLNGRRNKMKRIFLQLR
jgi:hypothetical protein